MLRPVTKKYRDISTDLYFQFSFYCDSCDKEWHSPIFYFSNPFIGELSRGQKAAYDILWRTEHDAAYERANLEARLHFNICRDTDDCICDDCLEKLEKKGE